MKRWFSSLLVVMLCVASVLTACSGSKSDGGSSNEGGNAGKSNSSQQGSNADHADAKVTLTFSHLWGGTDPRSTIYKERLQAFQQAYPNIELQVSDTPVSEYRKFIQVKLAGDSLPDVFAWWNGGQAKPILDANAVADLTDFMTNDPDMKDRISQAAFTGMTKDGKIYGAPTEIAYMGMFVNKEIFAKYNLEYPKTWDDLQHVVQVLNENHVTPIAAAGKEGLQLAIVYDLLLLNLVDQKGYEDSYTAKADLDQGFEKAAEYFKQLYDMKAFQDSVMVAPREQPGQLFDNGQAAMFIHGSFMINSFSEDTQKNIDVIPFPLFPESKPEAAKRTVFDPGMSYMVGAKVAKDQAKFNAAKTLIKYMTEDDFSQKMLQEVAVGSPNQHIDYGSMKLADAYIQMADMSKNSIESRPRITAVMTPAAADVLYNGLQGVLVGKITPKQFYDQVNEAFKKYQ